jgi:hypothetical protein
MNQINYTAMSDKDLKRYFLQHRDDKTALQAYLDRINEHPRQTITTVENSDFDTKIQAAIALQMNQ